MKQERIPKNEHQNNCPSSEENPSSNHEPKLEEMERRSWLRYSLRSLFAGTASAAVLSNLYRKRNINTPRNVWRYVQNLRSLESELAPAILSFHNELYLSRLSYTDITSDREYQETIVESLNAILRTIQKCDMSDLENRVREFAIVMRTAHLHPQQQKMMHHRCLKMLDERITYDISNLEKHDRINTLEVLSLGRVLHYANTTIDDVYHGTFDVRGISRHIAEERIVEAKMEPKNAFRTAEMCSLLDETMGLDLKSLLSEQAWKDLGKEELRQCEHNIRLLFMPRINFPTSYLNERFLTPNTIANYTRITKEDPDYQAACEIAAIQMKRVNMYVTLKRLQNGESY